MGSAGITVLLLFSSSPKQYKKRIIKNCAVRAVDVTINQQFFVDDLTPVSEGSVL